MKRYTIYGVAASQGRELKNQPYTVCEDPEGLWVKREDVEGLIQSEMLKSENLKCNCNCEEQAYKPDYEDYPDGLSPLPILLPPFWICPAHGYKRR